MAGAPSRNAGWTRANTNVGEVTAPPTCIALAIPLASTVFPAPSGPDNTTTSPATRSAPRLAPKARVSSAVGNSAVPSRISAMAAHPLPQPTRHRDELGRRRPLDESHQRVVDDLRSL